MLPLLFSLGLFDGGEGESTPSPGVGGAVGELAHVFGWPIYSDRSVSYTPTFSGGSWRSTLPLTNLAESQLARVARSTDALATSTTFDVDLKTARPVGLLALPKHTLSAAATVRWRGSNTSGDFADPVYDTGLLTAWPEGATAEHLDGINLSHVHVPMAAQSARYWRCSIADTTNPAGFIELARVVIAGAWYPEGIAVGAKLGLEADTERIVTDGGAALYRAKPVRRYWDFTVPQMDEDVAMATPLPMQRRLGQHGQLFFVYDVNDPFMHERAFLCVLRELSAVEYPFADYLSMPFRLLEEL